MRASCSQFQLAGSGELGPDKLPPKAEALPPTKLQNNWVFFQLPQYLFGVNVNYFSLDCFEILLWVYVSIYLKEKSMCIAVIYNDYFRNIVRLEVKDWFFLVICFGRIQKTLLQFN
jgi:hypothetical protein